MCYLKYKGFQLTDTGRRLPTKQPFSALWEKRDQFFIAAVVMTLVFAVGMSVQTSRKAARRQEAQLSTLRQLSHARNSIARIDNRNEDKSTPFPTDGTTRMDVTWMRGYAGDLLHALPEMEVSRQKYPNALIYLNYLCNFLLSADCPDYASLGPLLDASWPLRDAFGNSTEELPYGIRDLNDAMTAIADRLDTERRQAAWEQVAPVSMTESAT